MATTTDVAPQPGRAPKGQRPPAAPAPATPAGPSGLARVSLFYHDVLAEMRRVTWPARKELWESTVRIIVFVLFLRRASWMPGRLPRLLIAVLSLRELAFLALRGVASPRHISFVAVLRLRHGPL